MVISLGYLVSCQLQTDMEFPAFSNKLKIRYLVETNLLTAKIGAVYNVYYKSIGQYPRKKADILKFYPELESAMNDIMLKFQDNKIILDNLKIEENVFATIDLSQDRITYAEL